MAVAHRHGRFVSRTAEVGLGCSRQHGEADVSASPRTSSTPAATQNAHFQVDEYLEKWDQFAQGSNNLVPYLRDNKAQFEETLTQLLRSGDRQAPARMVFYAVVQVGGSIPADSPLGIAALTVLGGDFKVTATKDGKRILFAADLFVWWEKHQGEYDDFPIFDDWQDRDFAKKTVIPMYRRVQQQTG
jgi:hypothetical protein